MRVEPEKIPGPKTNPKKYPMPNFQTLKIPESIKWYNKKLMTLSSQDTQALLRIFSLFWISKQIFTGLYAPPKMLLIQIFLPPKIQE